MKNLYLRSTFKDIKDSLGRFIAIILIIFMGVLLFVGIKSVGPDLEETVQDFVEKNNVSDLQIVGTAGLTKEDQALAEKVDGAKVELGYSFPYTEDTKDLNLQVYSYQQKNKQNKLELVKGHYPKNDQEILVDEALKKDYPLNSKLVIDHTQMHQKNYTVAGFVRSPLYVDKKEKGVTTVGDGTLDGYVYLPEKAFAGDAFSIMYLRFSDLKNKALKSDSYQDQLVKKENQLEKLFATRKSSRKEELQAAGQKELAPHQGELAENKEKLAAGEAQLTKAAAELSQQKTQLAEQKAQLTEALGAEAAREQLQAAETQIAAAEAALSGEQQTLAENKTQLNTAEKQLADSQAQIAELKTPNYLMTERNSNAGFGEFTSLSDRIDAIGNVFPVFFFLIGILITFTTITRMIEENRKEIGTLKALGYRNSEIAQKYLLYAFLTGIIGTTLGIVLGTKLIPPIVFSMLKTTYIFSHYPTNFWFWPIVLAIIAALVATMGATIYILLKDLHEKPMALLLPKAPKPGKRIFLEYLTPLWRRLSFNQKVTYRNLFRYKARMILTILGIAGCTGLMVAGFGLRDSIGEVADIQFNDLNHFQGIVTLAEDQPAASAEEVKTTLKDHQVTGTYPVYTEQVKFKKEGVTDQTATLYGIEDQSQLQDYFTLKKATKGSATKLSNKGAIVTQGLAKAYDVTVGDTLTMQDSAGQKLKLKISGIVENYLGNNVFVKQDYLEKLADSKREANAFLIKTQKMSNQQEEKLAIKLQATKEVTTTTFMSDQVAKQGTASANLQPIVLLFILLSGTLAFVVLFNLTNINVSERERELATIKVLGFFDKEVTMYIIRENVIFTIVGILLGFGVGKILTWFIITMAGSDMMRFPLIIPPAGYAISAALTILFSAIVMGITHRKLKKIDMISALKSTE